MFRFVFLTVISAVISRCHGVDDPLVDPRGYDDISGNSPRPSNAEPTKLVCYFAPKALKRSGIGRFSVDDFDPFLCTHVVLAFAAINVADNSLDVPFAQTIELRTCYRSAGRFSFPSDL